MTTSDWEEKMRVIQELEKAKVQLSKAQMAHMYEQVAAALASPPPRFPVELKKRSRPILPEPDFSLEEIEQAKTVIEDLSR